MNSIGRVYRVQIFGESHGECAGIVVDGSPSGISLSPSDFLEDLGRRRPGDTGTTERKETDIPQIKSGIFEGKTTGAPILILFDNKNVRPEDYELLRDRPRPGHADFVAYKKYDGFNDFRGGGHFSGRLTVGLVAAGVIAKKILSPVSIKSELLEAGGSKNIETSVQSAVQAKDSIGGIVECCIQGLPVGLGEPFFDSVESLIGHLVFAIPGIKGIEFGSGFACARKRGSECNDAFLNVKGKTGTNFAGGINGGITNGNELVFRVAVKPASSIEKEQRTINLKTGKQDKISVQGRHDACIALRMPVIVEAAAVIVLADLLLLERACSSKYSA